MVQNRATCRLRMRCVPRTFQERLLCAVEHSDLTTEQIAQAAHVRYKRLRDYCSNPERRIPAVLLAEIVRVTGRVDLFDALLSPLGYEVRPKEGAGAVEPLPESSMDVSIAVGRLHECVRAAMANGRIDTDEVLELLECVRKVRTELADVESCLMAHQPAAVTR